jgi:hypothetical protein
LVRGVSLNAGSFAFISDCDDLICGGVHHPFSDLAAAAGELSEVGALHSAVTTIESSVVFGASRQSQLSTAPETCVRWSSRQLRLVAGCIKRFNACDWWALLSFVSLALILGFSHSGGPGSAPSIDPSFLLAQSTLALFTAVALSARGAHPQQAQVWFGIAELRVHSGGASTDGKLNEPFRSASRGGRTPRHVRIRLCSGDLLKRDSQRICRQRTTFDDLDHYISSLAFQSRTYTTKSGDGPRTN